MISALIGVLFIVAAVVVAFLTPKIALWVESFSAAGGLFASRRRKATPVEEKNTAPKKKKLNLKTLWGIKDIKNGVIIMDDDSYRMILRINPIDFMLVSVPEQTNIESSLMALAMSLSFPVQVFTTSEMVDAREVITNIYKHAPSLPEPLRDYSMELAAYIDALTANRSVNIRRSYLIISLDKDPKGFKHAYQELLRRSMIVANGFSRAKIVVDILDSNAVIDLLYNVFNGRSMFRPSEAVDAGALELYKGGMQLVFPEAS
ncbi:hypothetical protein NZJ93_12620 [Desulfofundulus thermocisternus]|nr:hypothetical protein [Desulfofundulus thermocisternus]